MDDLIIKANKSEKFQGINIDNFPTFNEQELRKKASQKLHAIARISRYLNRNKLRLIMNAFSFVPVWVLSTCLDVPQ